MKHKRYPEKWPKKYSIICKCGHVNCIKLKGERNSNLNASEVGTSLRDGCPRASGSIRPSSELHTDKQNGARRSTTPR